ncbi:MAG TPA: thermonuclease family protein [Rhizobiales bacterium]|nr:thermonuclease family protein [Hyphomicrobiales bacterium]
MNRLSGLRPWGSRARRPKRLLRRTADVFLAIAVLGALALVVARIDDGAAVRMEGRAEVGDGDSIVVGGGRIRLLGIDAPELDQTCQREGRDYSCGRESRRALAETIGSAPVACAGSERDRYDRLLARCRVGQTDLARSQVAVGWAIAYGDYQREEAIARQERLGLWAGTFERPGDWRQRHGAAAESEHVLPFSILQWLRAIFGFP